MVGCPRVRGALSRQGTLSYFEGPQSDHRCLYVNLTIDSLLGLNLDDSGIDPASIRPLRTGNPELTEAYITAMLKYNADHNMVDRISRLYDTHSNMSRSAVRGLLESWDNDQGRAMAYAEASLKVRIKPYHWSPHLRNAAVIYRYWTLRLRESLYGENYQQSFDRWETQIQEFDESFTLPERRKSLDSNSIRSHLNQSDKQLRKVQKASTDIRHKCYYDLLAQYDSDTHPATSDESKRKAK
jgi:hypothetical protein